ncbi:uncharacterized protein LOC118179470 [Stegodyphus dumicola]|uniref:uncharacterized protein LOC118179470 n=1 Tax=Stegodyphus dumicola TaxID=202533 RepID=UPI0015A9A896|nr:uncharacterized protein LOC118179470 [Stegodyphus dumicola]
MPVLEKICNDCNTDLCSLKEEAYVSASCCSDDCTILPYLEDTIEKATAISIEAASPLALNTITQNISKDIPFPGICYETNAALSVTSSASSLTVENVTASTNCTSYTSVVDINVNDTLKISDFQKTNIEETVGSFVERAVITSSCSILDSLNVLNYDNSFSSVNVNELLDKTDSQEAEVEENVSLLLHETINRLDSQGILKENIELYNKVRQTEEQVCDNRELSRTDCMLTISSENNVQMSNSNMLMHEHNDKHTHMQSEVQVQCDIKLIENEACARQQSKFETPLNEKSDERI